MSHLRHARPLKTRPLRARAVTGRYSVERRPARRTYSQDRGRGIVEALSAGKIAGAGLDTFDLEPIPPGHPLLTFDNVILSPHVGWVTNPNCSRFVESVIEAVRAFQWRGRGRIANLDALAAAGFDLSAWPAGR